MDCDCRDCSRLYRLWDWLEAEPGPWATLVMFSLLGLALMAAGLSLTW
ncbi:MAG: hypothetical protein PHZ19_07990 [Candidatus Thermoplasmatota archaeon]|nr:hypothetical protein [Candidatus Thermoplasmatota archaeon]